MRIVIDMQGAQTSESRKRGIGHYTESLAKAIVRNRGEHEIILALNGLFPDTIEPIRAAFNELLPQENIRVWYAPAPVRECEPGNEWRREVAERLREAFLASLSPDMVLVSSLFEGWGDDAITSLGVFAPQLNTVVTLYNIDSLLRPYSDLNPSPAYVQYYLRKTETLKGARGWLRLTDSPNQSSDGSGVPVLECVIGVSNGPAGTGTCPEITVYLPNENGENGDESHLNASWSENAQKAIKKFESIWTPAAKNRQADCSVNDLIQHIGAIKSAGGSEQDLLTTGFAIAANHPESRRKKLYVDISDLVQKNLRTGIQRVTKNILSTLLNNPPEDYQVEPVYATVASQGYYQTKRYAQQLTGSLGESQMDDPIDPQPGDIFIGLDFVVGIITAQQHYLKWMRNHGVRVYFVVYDLLPLKLPHAFPRGVETMHRQWLQVIANFDGAICISRVVQFDLHTWLKKYGSKLLRPFQNGWFHLGADLENSIPTRVMPDSAKDVLDQLAIRPNFLMVGTVEPRKGHAQTLAAFERLWADNFEANLVIVGKEGWMVDRFIKKLLQHPEHNHRLFWLEGISDEYQGKVYAASTCLIAASEGEGFGLPLIEAAQYKLPIIARDIPVFREVAGEHAFYFNGLEPQELADAIQQWFELAQQGKAPRSDNMPRLTWKQSAERLLAIILPKPQAEVFKTDLIQGD